MQTEPNYYQVLQISPKADPAIVKAAYYTHLKTLKKHPDLGGDHEEATLLNEAYEILGDPERRREYDNQHLKGFFSEASAPEPNPFVPDHESRKSPRVCFQNLFQFRKRPSREAARGGGSNGFAVGGGDASPYKSNSHWHEACFRDISLTGACFRSRDKFKEGETLDLDISDNPSVQIQAKVRWMRLVPQRFGSPVYEGGMEFKKVDEKNFRRYLKLVGLEKLLG